MRLALLCGRFKYAERGILDRTHLRFYTRSSAKRLLRNSGYEMLETKTTVMPPELALGLSPRNPLLVALTYCLRLATLCFPGLLGYQTILVARPKTTAAVTPMTIFHSPLTVIAVISHVFTAPYQTARGNEYAS